MTQFNQPNKPLRIPIEHPRKNLMLFQRLHYHYESTSLSPTITSTFLFHSDAKYSMIILHKILMNWKYMLEILLISLKCVMMDGFVEFWRNLIINQRWNSAHFQEIMFNYYLKKNKCFDDSHNEEKEEHLAECLFCLQ